MKSSMDQILNLSLRDLDHKCQDTLVLDHSFISVDESGLIICAPPLLQINQDTYAREEHKWDDSDLEGGPRAARFPSTLSVPEGAPC